MNTEPVSVVIEGENFLALPTQHIGGAEPVTVDTRFAAFLDDVALEDVTLEDSHTLRARIPEGLAPGWHTLAVVGPLGRRAELLRAYYASARTLASLSARALLERDKVSVAERTRLLLTVENTGGTAALAVTPVLHRSGDGQVEVITEPVPADIAPGASASFAWELGAASAGDLRFTLDTRGSESTIGLEFQTPGVEAGPLQIRERAVLTTALTVSPRVVPEGYPLKASLHVTNPGESAVLEVVPGVPVVSGRPVVPLSGPVPASTDIPAGESRDFEWTYTAGTVGTLSFRVGAVGRDGHSGVEVTAREAHSEEVTVQAQDVLVARFSHVPSNVDVGQPFDVELEVRNLGDTPVLGVMPEAAGFSGTAQMFRVSDPEPASVDIPGKGRTVFRIRLVGTSDGSFVFSTGARGVEKTKGILVRAPRVNSSSVNIRNRAVRSVTVSAPTGEGP
ncbi:hypothetical protein [Vitiosangium sp. GDMCC 1.1324]|uniref:hypothetical protein n=1 Tax=Vitiosangium sp. (strain GDMCC 1.1324) TaxID=2138576 RepID=UPI000D34F90D|nr:hypothetical protein [Vitiosangium sp. GDMCC 1.1324]PTL85305.1 hypothetical protein DAT35_00850 [Vitiosangium sp. GDMCC 1.1324]